jgi:hypothetical protein
MDPNDITKGGRSSSYSSSSNRSSSRGTKKKGGREKGRGFRGVLGGVGTYKLFCCRRRRRRRRLGTNNKQTNQPFHKKHKSGHGFRKHPKTPTTLF